MTDGTSIRKFLAQSKKKTAAKSDEVLKYFNGVLEIRKKETLASFEEQAMTMYTHSVLDAFAPTMLILFPHIARPKTTSYTQFP